MNERTKKLNAEDLKRKIEKQMKRAKKNQPKTEKVKEKRRKEEKQQHNKDLRICYLKRTKGFGSIVVVVISNVITAS